jgi:hypothetical protein
MLLFLLYSKTYLLPEGEENQEICPICQMSLGFEVNAAVEAKVLKYFHFKDFKKELFAYFSLVVHFELWPHVLQRLLSANNWKR